MSHHKRADQAAISKLEEQGANIEMPHPVEFFLYFPTEWDACVAATQLMNLQFEVSLNASKDSDQWLCLATKKLKPTSERLMEVSNFMDEVAGAHNGNYDGWGTPVLEEDLPEDE